MRRHPRWRDDDERADDVRGDRDDRDDEQDEREDEEDREDAEEEADA